VSLLRNDSGFDQKSYSCSLQGSFKVTKLDSGRVPLSEISALFLPMALLMATEIPSYYSEVFKRRGQHAGQTGQIYRQNCNELQKQS
jgi:hypothetical protein